MTFAEEDTNGHQEESEGQEARPPEGHAAEAQGWRRNQRRGQQAGEHYHDHGRLVRWIVPGYIHAVDIYNGETFSRVRSGAGLAGWIHHREVMWLEPQVVAEITYAEIVQGRLRAPVFRGFHSDGTTARRRARNRGRRGEDENERRSLRAG